MHVVKQLGKRSDVTCHLPTSKTYEQQPIQRKAASAPKLIISSDCLTLFNHCWWSKVIEDEQKNEEMNTNNEFKFTKGRVSAIAETRQEEALFHLVATQATVEQVEQMEQLQKKKNPLVEKAKKVKKSDRNTPVLRQNLFPRPYVLPLTTQNQHSFYWISK